MTAPISAPAARAASTAAARLREALRGRRVYEVQAERTEADGTTMLLFAVAASHTVTAGVVLDPSDDTSPEAIAAFLLEKLR